ncbi:MAG: cytochrome c [Siculibacillus sp.]|nr:cytochrome c [Siculibacillus sp.]
MKKSIFGRLLPVVVLVGGASMASTAWAQAGAEMLANTCAGCHGPDGSSNGPATPTIASLSTDYFVMSMKDYKSGKRPSTVMARIAKGYSDDDIAAMAKYFQTKPFQRPGQKVDADKAKAGKALAKKYCESCHEDEGRVGEGVGVLAGQMLPYLQYSMVDFLSLKRETEKRQKAKFDALVKDLGEEAFQPILHYYAGVK